MSILVYIGSAAIVLWGAGHIGASRSVLRDFASLSTDSRRIIAMEWVAEGLTLCFLGVIPLMVTLMGEPGSPAAVAAVRGCAGMLIALAILSAFTGARTSIAPMRACPFVKTSVAVLFLLSTFL